MSIQSIKTKDQFMEELKIRFPNEKIEILSYTKASGPIEYRCLICGATTKKSRANHLYENKILCKNCHTGKTSKMRNSFLKALAKSTYELVDNSTHSVANKFLLKCKRCGRLREYKIQQYYLLSCPYCNNYNGGAPVPKDLAEKRIREQFPNDHYTILLYNGFSSSILMRHEECGYIFSQNGGNFLKGRGCPKCHGKKSFGEKKIQNFLEKHEIRYYDEYMFLDYAPKKYRFDFYLPDYNLIIEFHGKQHYEPIPLFGGERKFLERTANDLAKENFLKQKGINLLIIPYHKIDEIDKILESSTTISRESRVKRPEAESIPRG